MLELRAIFLALRQWAPLLHGLTVAIHCDNRTAVAYFLKEGGTKSHPLMEWSRRLLTIADKWGIHLREYASSPGYGESGGRCSLLLQESGGVGNLSGPGQNPITELGSPSGGPVRVSPQHSGPQIFLHLKRGPSGQWARCPPSEVGFSSHVRLPSPSPHLPDIEQTLRVPGGTGSNHPPVGGCRLVGGGDSIITVQPSVASTSALIQQSSKGLRSLQLIAWKLCTAAFPCQVSVQKSRNSLPIPSDPPPIIPIPLLGPHGMSGANVIPWIRFSSQKRNW